MGRGLTLARFLFFATFASGGGGCDPPGVSKLSVLEFSEKNSGLLMTILAIGSAFLILGQNLTQFWGIKGQIFVKSAIFQISSSIFQKL